MNRLLINMKNKVSVIDGAIEQCKKLMKNEEIHLNGLHNLKITRGKLSDIDLQNRINELNSERFDLIVRINRIES